MSIAEVMTYGCNGFTETEIAAEQKRRLRVAARINRIGAKIACAETDKRTKTRLRRQLRQIKAAEKVWLSHAAWFLYD